jgi:hypothetical protein
VLALPPPLFKYTKRVYAEALVREGKIRIGTLHDYRRIERHAPMIADEDEGKKARYDNPVMASAGGLSPFARSVADRMFSNLPTDPQVRVLFAQCVFEEVETSSNRWLYCTSARLGASVMRSMDPAYDSCIRIDYVDAFFQAIAQELGRQNLIATPGRIVRCKYRERTQHYLADDGLDPVTLKAPKFWNQQEVRFVYFPSKEITVDHHDLTIPRLRDFCELDPRVDTIE